jgi:hypothetical protein
MGTSFEGGALPDPGDTPTSWTYDVILDELRDVVVPAVADGFAARRAKGLARLVKYLREVDRLGGAAQRAELADLREVLGYECTDLESGRAELCAAIDAGTVDERRVLEYCHGVSARETQLLRPAMGALADRHYSPID